MSTRNNPKEQPGESLIGARNMAQTSMIFHEVLRLIDAFKRKLALTLKVNSTDLDAMEHLLRHGPLQPTSLSQKLGISSAATTLVIDRLEKAGHVQRTAHPQDRRSLWVTPTDHSVAQAFSVIRPLIFGVDAVLDDYTAEESAIIESYLSKVAGIYRQLIDE